MTLRPSSIIVVALFVLMFLAGVLPRSLTRATVVEVLPSTSYGSPTTLTHELIPTPQQTGAEMESFATTVINGQPNTVVGVFAPGRFALPVMQQPADQPTFVSTDDQVLTQFGLPSQYGTTAILAHNYLSGKAFYTLDLGDEIAVIYGDGQARYFRIREIQQFQALKPYSPYSDFVDLSDPTAQVISSATLFTRIYTASGQLVFQTCIDAQGDPSWGRMFVIAEPISDFSPASAANPPAVFNN